MKCNLPKKNRISPRDNFQSYHRKPFPISANGSILETYLESGVPIASQEFQKSHSTLQCLKLLTHINIEVCPPFQFHRLVFYSYNAI